MRMEENRLWKQCSNLNSGNPARPEGPGVQTDFSSHFSTPPTSEIQIVLSNPKHSHMKHRSPDAYKLQ